MYKIYRFFFYTSLTLSLVLIGFGSYLLHSYRDLGNIEGQVLGALEFKESPQSNFDGFNYKSKIANVNQIKSKSLFFGDVFWGRRIDNWSKDSQLGFAYPFSGLDTFGKQDYDAWIANLECPLTKETLTEYQQEVLLKFTCSPEYLPEASKYFDVFTLGNNHMDNMEEFDGLNQTRQNLDKYEIQYFGHFDNSVTKDLCEVISLPAKSYKTTGQIETTYLPVAMCAYHNVFKLPLEKELAEIEKYAKILPVIVMPHQGAEYKNVADSLQTQYYRKMIDLGADVVIGNHPHAVQNTEVYKDKLILYSLGNFIFDQQANSNVTRGVALEVEINYQVDTNLAKWLVFSEACKEFKDTCIAKAEELELQKPEISLRYDLIGTDNSGKLAKKASPEVQSSLYQITNWSETKRKLLKSE